MCRMKYEHGWEIVVASVGCSVKDGEGFEWFRGTFIQCATWLSERGVKVIGLA